MERDTKSRKINIGRVFKFGLVGLTGTAVNEGLLWLLTYPAGLHHGISAVFSIEASIISNFVLNDIWTFRDRREGSALRRALKYNMLAAAGAVINWVIFMGLTEKADIHPLIAMPLAIMVCFVWNFSFSVLWAWRK